jgi:hypothetical protein
MILSLVIVKSILYVAVCATNHELGIEILLMVSLFLLLRLFVMVPLTVNFLNGIALAVSFLAAV